MIIAKNLSITTLLREIPEQIWDAAFSPEIHPRSSKYSITVAGEEIRGNWLTCCHAWPHHDSDGFAGQYFLTLSVVSNHFLCDEVWAIRAREQAIEEAGKGCSVFPGTLSIIDPEKVHWLQQGSAWCSLAPLPWIALQFDVPKEHGKEAATKIIKKFKGQWLPLRSIDPRYVEWCPI